MRAETRYDGPAPSDWMLRVGSLSQSHAARTTESSSRTSKLPPTRPRIRYPHSNRRWFVQSALEQSQGLHLVARSHIDALRKAARCKNCSSHCEHSRAAQML